MKEKTTVGTTLCVVQTTKSKLISFIKSILIRAKAYEVEESKKGHTGDALALRGDEGRDKLR